VSGGFSSRFNRESNAHAAEGLATLKSVARRERVLSDAELAEIWRAVGLREPRRQQAKKTNRNKIQEISGAQLTEQTPIVREYFGLHAMRMIFLADLESQACPEHFHGIEIKLGVERALDVGGLAEAMLLPRE
jgi:hypothetical protein